MSKIRQYTRESVHELLHHVTWPTWAELQKYTVIILIASILFGLGIWLVDYVWGLFLSMVVYGA